MKTRAFSPALLGFFLVTACTASTGSPPGAGGAGGGGAPVQPRTLDGTPVTVALTADQRQEVDRLAALLAETRDLTAEQLLAKRALPFRASLGYDPNTSVDLPLIQSSALALDADETAVLANNGFVVSDRKHFPHFAMGYQAIYSQDLPVFISADSILQAVHQSYDDILKVLESESLRPQLAALFAEMRTSLPGAPGVDAGTRKDVDLFLAVALSLLQDRVAAGVAGANAAEVQSLFDKAKAASGSQAMDLFGVKRDVDFSQFKPRGHYAGIPELESYFRATMWIGRIDFPMLATDPTTGKQTLVRRSVAAALALRGLMSEAAFARWKAVDAVIRAFVGEADSMSPLDVDRLKTDLGITGNDVGGVSDDTLAQALVAGAYGKQKILSQIVIQNPHDGAWPLDATFLFFGQRYVLDSHVFSNVVYDRVRTRLMPDPLDVAYAALGNDQAAALLSDELKRYPYAPALEGIRRLADEHGDAFWQANLYNLWMSALRALSPAADPMASGVPPVAATEAWGRRVLNAQLASWAELRHDTLLYAKQSYTSGVACAFPDAYVDPYPAFFGAFEKMGQAGSALVAQLSLSADLSARITTYFTHLAEVSGILRAMAEDQRTGMPHTPEQLAFINRAVNTRVLGCGGPPAIEGWYADLFFDPSAAAKFDPTIADVHTQPTDEAGNSVGRVLHVGTGWSRLIVVSVETCTGPHAYAGVVSSFHQVVTQDFERLDDATWAKRFTGGTSPEDVSWMHALIVK